MRGLGRKRRLRCHPRPLLSPHLTLLPRACPCACAVLHGRVKALCRGDATVVEEAVQRSSSLQLCSADGSAIPAWHQGGGGATYLRRSDGAHVPELYGPDGACCRLQRCKRVSGASSTSTALTVLLCHTALRLQQAARCIRRGSLTPRSPSTSSSQCSAGSATWRWCASRGTGHPPGLALPPPAPAAAATAAAHPWASRSWSTPPRSKRPAPWWVSTAPMWS